MQRSANRGRNNVGRLPALVLPGLTGKILLAGEQPPNAPLFVSVCRFFILQTSRRCGDLPQYNDEEYNVERAPKKYAANFLNRQRSGIPVHFILFIRYLLVHRRSTMQINTLGTYTYAFLAFSMVLFGQLGEITATAPSNPSSSGSAPPLRGVSPTDYAAFYTLASTFTCKSGALMLPYAKVNDNYCDCPDGSDEPGTSACSMIPGAKFYCANVGDDEMYIKSMFVDDGVCDCCDGSDEGVGRCKDTCLEDGKGKLVRLQASLKEAEEGMKENEKVLKEARERRLGWEKRLEVLEGMESRVAQVRECRVWCGRGALGIPEDQRKEMSRLERWSISPNRQNASSYSLELNVPCTIVGESQGGSGKEECRGEVGASEECHGRRRK
jgi:hypothetical protein